MLLSPALFGGGRVAVLSGPVEGTAPVTFRAANETSAAGQNVLYLRRAPRTDAEIPNRAVVASIDGQSVVDPFSWPLALLQRIDEIHVDSMHALRGTLAMVQTLKSIPALLVVDNLSQIVDPLFASSHSDFEFLNQALAARGFLDDAVDALDTLCGRQQTKIIITDRSNLDSSYVNIISRGNAAVSQLTIGRSTIDQNLISGNTRCVGVQSRASSISFSCTTSKYL